MVFFYNEKDATILTYENLLNRINASCSYSNVIDETDPVDFFVKLLVNACYNIDSIILDNDLSIENKQNIIENKNFQSKRIEFKKEFNNWEYLLTEVLKTESKVGIFTSGTTGKPKQVIHSINKFIGMARIGEKYQQNVWGFLYNPTHMAGLQVFFQAFLNRNTIVYLFECNRNEFIKNCEIQEVTNVSGTPTFYRLLSPFDFKLEKIKKCTLGGEKCNTELIKKIEIIFPNASIYNIYASTEAGSIFISRGDTFKVIESLKEKVKFEDNEIIIHNSLLGEFDKGEWFYTGDIVEFTNESETQFKVVSRKSDTINIGGNRINLLEIENEIYQLEGIERAVVYAIDNSVLGKVITCEVVSTVVYSKKQFKDALKKRLQHYKIPTIVKFVEDLQVTRTGKLKRN